jgi:hypothetical protein
MTRVIGCIAVTDVVMFTPDEWVPTPADWSANIVPAAARGLCERRS